MKSATYIASLLILLAVLGSAQLLFAQGTDLGTITGSVTDSTGAYGQRKGTITVQ